MQNKRIMLFDFYVLLRNKKIKMKNLFLIGIAVILSFHTQAKNNITVELPEVYELANVILAMTEYGRTDDWEVLKATTYYREVLNYFEPVKNHPLLDSVNYSRERWKEYLSFRTDAYAFEFDDTNKLRRYVNFFSVEGHTPFDDHLSLIDDFVDQSNFRQFYHLHQTYYNNIVQNYSDYYFIDKSYQFLDDKIGKSQNDKNEYRYVTVLSPLVNRMNCHRDIDDQTVADFPSATPEFLNGITENNLYSRLNGNHMVFTEMDHGYINPVSDKYSTFISEHFNNERWDIQSGYQGLDVFNEYMTWAVYDIFVRENFPAIADSITLPWQYQNALRGFYAQNLFTQKVIELYMEYKNVEAIYEPLLTWCKEVEKTISLPTLLSVDKNNFVKTDVSAIQLHFSEEMNIRQNRFLRRLTRTGAPHPPGRFHLYLKISNIYQYWN